jgi:hypothetical protein
MKLLAASIILLGSRVTAIPAPVPQGIVPAESDWTKKQCTDQYINDAAAPAAQRWSAAAADQAWTSVELSWNQEGLPAGDVPLNLSAYVGNFFHTKERLACENLADNPCDDTILCTDTTPAVPAG